MPNYCYNSLEVRGKKKDLIAFKKKYKSKNYDINFNLVIPNDFTKKQLLPKWKSLSDDDKTRWSNDFDHYWYNMIGHHWQSLNWGTKWNSIDCTSNLDKTLNYSFTTAWSPPTPVVEKLIVRHPELSFTLEYVEDGEGYGGELSGCDGVVEKDENWNLDQQECPKCEVWNVKPEPQEFFECCECGAKFNLQPYEDRE